MVQSLHIAKHCYKSICHFSILNIWISKGFETSKKTQTAYDPWVSSWILRSLTRLVVWSGILCSLKCHLELLTCYPLHLLLTLLDLVSLDCLNEIYFHLILQLFSYLWQVTLTLSMKHIYSWEYCCYWTQKSFLFGWIL